jgi:hypothetical protein
MSQNRLDLIIESISDQVDVMDGYERVTHDECLSILEYLDKNANRYTQLLDTFTLRQIYYLSTVDGLTTASSRRKAKNNTQESSIMTDSECLEYTMKRYAKQIRQQNSG